MIADKIFLLTLLFVAYTEKVYSNECLIDENNAIRQIKNLMMARPEQKQEQVQAQTQEPVQDGSIAETLKNIQLQLQENAAATKAMKECQKFLHGMSVNGTMYFKETGTIYHFNATLLSRNETQLYCQQKGMELVTLKTFSQMDSLAKELKNRVALGSNFWLSASDIKSTPGQYNWLDGTPVEKSMWHFGQPKSFREGAETCAYLQTFSAKLYDQKCSTGAGAYIVCEVPHVLASCL